MTTYWLGAACGVFFAIPIGIAVIQMAFRRHDAEVAALEAHIAMLEEVAIGASREAAQLRRVAGLRNDCDCDPADWWKEHA